MRFAIRGCGSTRTSDHALSRPSRRLSDANDATSGSTATSDIPRSSSLGSHRSWAWAANQEILADYNIHADLSAIRQALRRWAERHMIIKNGHRYHALASDQVSRPS